MRIKDKLTVLAAIVWIALLPCQLPAATMFSGLNQPPTGTSLLTNLEAYYKYDESAGANAVDATGNGNTLADTGGTVTSGPGIINTARITVVSGDSYFQAASSDPFRPGSRPFSWTGWVNPSSLPTYAGVAGIYDSTGNNREWIVLYDVSGRWYFTMSPDGTSTTSLDSGVTATTGVWTFLAVVWTGTMMEMSVNGAAFTTTAFAGPVFTSTGSYEVGSFFAGAFTLNGSVDESGFWMNRALTLTEVQRIYNGGAGLPLSSF